MEEIFRPKVLERRRLGFDEFDTTRQQLVPPLWFWGGGVVILLAVIIFLLNSTVTGTDNVLVKVSGADSSLPNKRYRLDFAALPCATLLPDATTQELVFLPRGAFGKIESIRVPIGASDSKNSFFVVTQYPLHQLSKNHRIYLRCGENNRRLINYIQAPPLTSK